MKNFELDTPDALIETFETMVFINQGNNKSFLDFYESWNKNKKDFLKFYNAVINYTANKTELFQELVPSVASYHLLKSKDGVHFNQYQKILTHKDKGLEFGDVIVNNDDIILVGKVYGNKAEVYTTDGNFITSSFCSNFEDSTIFIIGNMKSFLTSFLNKN